MKNKILIIVIIFLCFNMSVRAFNNADTTYFPEIIITANKYAKNIYEIPLAVSFVKQKQFQNSLGSGFGNALNTVPGVLSISRSGTADSKITIRGFGARGAGDRSNSGTSRGIKFILDGIPESEPDGRTAFDLIDMAFVQNIEVLRSNTSSLYGNAAGGVISLTTFPENSDDFLKIDAMGGSFGFQKYAISAFKNTSGGGLLGNLSYSKSDGYRENSNSEKILGNFIFKGQISDKTDIKTLMTFGYNQFQIPGPLSLIEFNSSPEKANSNYLHQKEGRTNYVMRIGGIINHYIDDNNSISANFYANPKYLERSERKTFRQFTRYKIGGNLNYKNSIQFSEKFFNTAIIGIDEQYQDGAILFYSLKADASRGALKTNKREGANSFGLYLQDELKYKDFITAVFGLRYDAISYYSDLFYEAGEDSLIPYEKKTFSRLTPKAAIAFNLSNHHSIYLNYGGGIEVPAGNETSPSDEYPNLQVNPLLDPIISNTYEIGTKHWIKYPNSIDFKYDIALFYIDVKNELVPYLDGKFYMSAGKTSRYGIESNFDFGVFESLFLNMSATYMKSKYSEYIVDLGLLDKNNTGKYLNYKDNKMAGVPDIFYNISLKYAMDFLANTFVEANLRGVGKYFADDANYYEVPAYTLLNLTIGLDDYISITDDFKFRIYASINNILDTKYSASSFINPSVKQNVAYYLEPGLPRNFIFGVSLQFD